MNPEQLTIAIVLIVSSLLSAGYAFWLDHIQEHYIPNGLVVVVAIGDGAICDTILILEHQLGVMITGLVVVGVMLAWGIPIIIWQLGQWEKRIRLARDWHSHHGACK